MEFGDSAVQLVQEELKKLRRKAEFVSSVDLATKASDMYSRGCSMEEIHDFIIAYIIFMSNKKYFLK